MLEFRTQKPHARTPNSREITEYLHKAVGKLYATEYIGYI